MKGGHDKLTELFVTLMNCSSGVYVISLQHFCSDCMLTGNQWTLIALGHNLYSSVMKIIDPDI